MRSQLRRGHATRGADVLHRVLERHRDFVVGGLASQLLGQIRLRPAHPDELGVLVQGNAHAAGLLRERLEHGLAHPPHGVGDEFHALVRIEFLDGLEQALVTDRHQLRQIEAVSLILLHVGDHEPQVRRDEALGGLLVAALHPPGEPPLFGGILDQREFLDVLQVLIEGAGRGGFEKRLGFSSRRTGHALDSQAGQTRNVR
ncbi:MAG: hypothetical protein HW398_1159 [Acidobacteria bacterium]|nr:hypothetical protein [Acidobacteriota bacterium]